MDDLAALVSAYPLALTYNPESQIQPTVEFLQSELGIQETGSKECLPLYAWPDSGKRLLATTRFLKDEMGYSQTTLAESPILLSFDLEQRVWPRSQYMEEKGLIPPLPPVSLLTAKSEEEFCTVVGIKPDAWAQYKKGCRAKWSARVRSRRSSAGQ